MKKLVFLLFFISISIFSSPISIVSITKHPVSKNPNNSTYYNIKKADDEHKKSSFKEKIHEKVFIHQIEKNAPKKLQTLVIKLDSIKQLHLKDLLKKEIIINTDYYHNFLIALKNSPIIKDEYVFLENELLKVTIVNTSKKYESTLNTSLLLVFALIIVTLFLILSHKKKAVIIDLTKQEIIIKNLITDGKTNKEIASALHISLNTVKTHISNIYQKLNVSNRKDLMLRFKN